MIQMQTFQSEPYQYKELCMNHTPAIKNNGKRHDVVTLRKNRNMVKATVGCREISCFKLVDLIKIEELQAFQEDFARATGVASIILDVDGNSITQASNYSQVCKLIRQTEKGRLNCNKSRIMLGRISKNLTKPRYQPCLGIGFMNASAPIIVKGHHIGNWVIGQYAVDGIDEKHVFEYARKIETDPNTLLNAFRLMPKISLNKFKDVLVFLWELAGKMSNLAYGNWLLLQKSSKLERVGKELMLHKKSLEKLVQSQTMDILESNNKLKVEIEERKQTEKALNKARLKAEDANIAKSQFLANMSHEIRTPMNAIIGMTELLQDTELSVGQKEYLDAIENASDILLKLVDDILDLSKIESGYMELESIDFLLQDTMEESIQTLAFKADKKGLELACEIDPNIPAFVTGDPGKVRQILINLIGNAIKFTEKGEIVVRCFLDAQNNHSTMLHFTVSDTGIGIPSEKSRTIFEAFRQADESTTRKYGGTGLGLSISAQLTRLMGGKIWVEPAPAGGTTFHFTIEAGIPESKQIPKWLSVPIDFKGKTALIVDDNDTYRMILKRILSSWGMETRESRKGSQAIDIIESMNARRKSFDLIFMDMRMPEMDGFELSRRIRDITVDYQPKIILLTSVGQRGDANACRENGITAYLVKPIKKSDLYETVQFVLSSCKEKDTGNPVKLVTRHTVRESRKLKGCRILLAEDDLINRKIAVKMLEKHGHSVTTAENGEQAVRLAASEMFDIILMDIQMPVMDGYESTAKIREIESDQKNAADRPDAKPAKTPVPIIAMTAHAFEGYREKCLEKGMDDYISKPINSEKVIKIVKKWMPESARKN